MHPLLTSSRSQHAKFRARRWAAAALGGLALMGLLASPAHAQSDVQWSVRIGSPGYRSTPPPAVYVEAPPPIYRPVRPYPDVRWVPVETCRHPRHRDERRWEYRDRDRDGVPDRWDRRPRDPWRY